MRPLSLHLCINVHAVIALSKPMGLEKINSGCLVPFLGMHCNNNFRFAPFLQNSVFSGGLSYKIHVTFLLFNGGQSIMFVTHIFPAFNKDLMDLTAYSWR